MALLGVRAYARHRGTSHVSVLNAIKTGKLASSVKLGPKGKPQIDPDLADREWPLGPKELFRDERGYNQEKIAEQERAIPTDDDVIDRDENGISYARILQRARAKREDYRAKLAKIELDKAAGKVVEASAIKQQWLSVATAVRNKILGIPTKLKQRNPELTDDQYSTLEALIREALEDLSNGG